MGQTTDHTTGPTGTAPALRVQDLSVGYGTTTVVRGVSLEVRPGSVCALLGPNGAGKTTLLKSISGLLKPLGGSVHLFGEDVTEQSVEARSRQGLCSIPEGRGIYRSLTVRENLVMQAPRRKEALALERATAAFPKLGERLRQQAGTLSGGEQQMLSLASAYVRDPRLIVVDEASLGLAPIIVDAVFEFLGQLADTGTSMLIVDQFAPRALALASHGYVLRRGELVYSGSAAELSTPDVFDRYLSVSA